MCNFAAKLLKQLTMKLRLLLFSLVISTTVWADPDFSKDKKYHIVCSQFSAGCVVDGASAHQNTPLYHLQEATTDAETYWLMNDEGDGYFSIKNAKTGQYVTYDGQRQDSPMLLRYVNMTDEMDGRNSLWAFIEYTDGVYAIRNAEKTDHLAAGHVQGDVADDDAPAVALHQLDRLERVDFFVGHGAGLIRGSLAEAGSGPERRLHRRGRFVLALGAAGAGGENGRDAGPRSVDDLALHEGAGVAIQEIVGAHTQPEEFDLLVQVGCIV